MNASGFSCLRTQAWKDQNTPRRFANRLRYLQLRTPLGKEKAAGIDLVCSIVEYNARCQVFCWADVELANRVFEDIDPKRIGSPPWTLFATSSREQLKILRVCRRVNNPVLDYESLELPITLQR